MHLGGLSKEAGADLGRQPRLTARGIRRRRPGVRGYEEADGEAALARLNCTSLDSAHCPRAELVLLVAGAAPPATLHSDGFGSRSRVIRTALATRVDGEVEQGRTRPLRCAVELADGEERELYLKATGPELSVEGLCNEMLGSLLAGDLGLPTPEPFFVELTPELIDAVPSPGLQSRLAAASPLAFGSTDAGSPWRRWNSTDRVTPDLAAQALKVLAFDAFIGNPDRSPPNPNLLTQKHGSGLLLIDHEVAFGVRIKLFPPVRPWQMGNLSPLSHRGTDAEHVFFTGLSGRADLPFEEVADAWATISDVRLGAYDATLPDAWADARPALTEAVTHIKVVRDRMAECILELRRVLA